MAFKVVLGRLKIVIFFLEPSKVSSYSSYMKLT